MGTARADTTTAAVNTTQPLYAQPDFSSLPRVNGVDALRQRHPSATSRSIAVAVPRTDGIDGRLRHARVGVVEAVAVPVLRGLREVQRIAAARAVRSVARVQPRVGDAADVGQACTQVKRRRSDRVGREVRRPQVCAVDGAEGEGGAVGGRLRCRDVGDSRVGQPVDAVLVRGAEVQGAGHRLKDLRGSRVVGKGDRDGG